MGLLAILDNLIYWLERSKYWPGQGKFRSTGALSEPLEASALQGQAC